jgi:hypothetical protein
VSITVTLSPLMVPSIFFILSVAGCNAPVATFFHQIWNCLWHSFPHQSYQEEFAGGGGPDQDHLGLLAVPLQPLPC